MALYVTRRLVRAVQRGGVLLCALACVAFPSWVSGQGNSPKINYTKQIRFWIPFEPDGAINRLRLVELHVSRDQGRTWSKFDSTGPTSRGFQFFAESDGIYGFTVRTIDLENRPFPETLQGSQPQLVVCVDTAPPSVRLFPLSPQEGIGVGWDIRDANLDLGTFRLEGRAPGGDWRPLQVDPAAAGRWSWQAGGAGMDEVRLQVRDRAGNPGEATTSLTGRQIGNRTYPPDPSGTGGRPMLRLVNSTRISINYRVENVGPSKATVELWWTRTGGRTWEKYPEPMPAQPPFLFNAPGEGVYGFTLVARSGVNLGDSPPQANDPPQVSVEVDLKEPVVQLTGVRVGRGSDVSRMTITWTARDANLEERPVKLEYATVTSAGGQENLGPWQEIVANLPSSGEYIWSVPEDGVLFHVRATARDRAGNIGQAKTPKPIIVDLMRPRGVILDVEPVRGQPNNSSNSNNSSGSGLQIDLGNPGGLQPQRQ